MFSRESGWRIPSGSDHGTLKRGIMEQTNGVSNLPAQEGRPAITISAMSGGNAEMVLRTIAASGSSFKYYRTFGDWYVDDDGCLRCPGQIGRSENPSASVNVTLILGRNGGDIPIMDDDMRGKSEWHPYRTGREYTVRVGRGVPSGRIANIASQLVAWVARGGSWIDCRGDLCNRAYGKDPGSKPAISTKLLADLQRRFRRRDSFFAHM